MSGYVYILRCSDGSYYVGSTTNLEVRLAEHETGSGGDYTSRRRPLTLVFSEEFPSLQQAFAAERQVKGWRRAKKEALIRGDFAALPALARTARGSVDQPNDARVLRQAQDAGT